MAVDLQHKNTHFAERGNGSEPLPHTLITSKLLPSERSTTCCCSAEHFRTSASSGRVVMSGPLIPLHDLVSLNFPFGATVSAADSPQNINRTHWNHWISSQRSQRFNLHRWRPQGGRSCGCGGGGGGDSHSPWGGGAANISWHVLFTGGRCANLFVELVSQAQR